MSSTTLVLLALALGALVGSAFTLAVTFAKRAGERRAAAIRPPLPTSAVEVLDGFESAAILMDASLQAVHMNAIARDQTVRIENLPLRDAEFLRSLRTVLDTGAPFMYTPDADNPNDDTRVKAYRVAKKFVVVLIEDVGEQQRLFTMRRDFIANISHELKTPIAAIGLLSEAIVEGADDPELVRQFAQKLVKESRRMGDLSRDVIHLSQAQSELTAADRRPVDMVEVIRSEVEQHRTFAATRDVEIVLSPLDEGESAELLGDEAGIRIAFANVLSNAIRYSHSGGSVGVGMTLEGKTLSVAITDHGPGIPVHAQSRVFERFYRGDSSRNRAFGGTGLGLSIAKNTLRTHGGHIDLWSEEGVGSTFTLVFPLHDRVEAERRKEQRKSKKRLSRTRKAVQTAQQNAESRETETPR